MIARLAVGSLLPTTLGTLHFGGARSTPNVPFMVAACGSQTNL
jgi:hypothetical protein